MSEHRRVTAHVVEHRAEVRHHPVEAVLVGVTAVAPSPPVRHDERELVGEPWNNGGPDGG